MNLVTSLLRDGHDVWFCSGGDTSDASTRLPAGVIFIPLKLEQHEFSLISDFKLLQTFSRLINEISPDIVHTFTIKPNLYFALTLAFRSYFHRRQPRLIMTFPGLGRVFEPGGGTGMWMRRWLVGIALRSAIARLEHAATFENPHDRDLLVSSGIFNDANAFAIMGAGVDLKRFRVGNSKSENAPFTFVFASRLLKSKGVESYIKSAKAMAEAGSKSRFILAGPVDLSNPDAFDVIAYEAQHTLGPVEYLGMIPQSKMPGILQQADVICLPTELNEGFPRILVEAAACGCAMIASNQPAIRQIVIEGETGRLIEPKSPDQLTESMKYFEKSPEHARSIGAAAARFARTIDIDDDSVVDAIFKLYSIT